MNRPQDDMTNSIDAVSRFERDMVAWLNRRFGDEERWFERGTLLFEDGLIDSIRILEIIAWVEEASGRTIPDREIRMDRFRSVRRIARHFAKGADDVDGH